MVSVLLLLLLLMPASATAIGIACGSGRNYTANSTYQSNLASLAATLPGNASSSPQLFVTATLGVVHALALCRHDTTNTTACDTCIDSSFKYAQKMCPDRKTGATVYYDYDEVDALQPGCILGFSGEGDFLSPASSITGNGTFFQFWNPANIPGNGSVIAAAVHELLAETARDAAATARGFATAFMDSIGGGAPTLYSLAQCTPDLSAGDCLACLQRLVGTVNATNVLRLGGRIFVLRCNISGYMAPEYASHGLFSIKSDVFSFGVLVLEIISGKRNSHECGAFINLVGHAWQLFEEERWIELIDAALPPNGHSAEIMRFINIALLCVQEDAIDRPTMLDVVAMLSSDTMILYKPKHPAYFSLSVGDKEASSTTTTQSCSINDVTVSTVTGR